jgi:hypothetical protein
VTTILKSFGSSSDDEEVMGMKRSERKQWKERLLLESRNLAIAMFDPRFKHHFFRSQEAFQAAKKTSFFGIRQFHFEPK